jgi:hypothetical protein
VGATARWPRGPDAINAYQKSKLRGDANRADYLERRPSLGLVTYEARNRATVELDAADFQKNFFQCLRRASGRSK